MTRCHASLAVVALAAAMSSTSSFAEQSDPGAAKEEPMVSKKIAFHVMGLMKTKSGAT